MNNGDQTVTPDDLRRALLGSLANVAPLGGERSVPTNFFCNSLIDVLVDMLVGTELPAETERLVDLFRAKLMAAMRERYGACGHA